MTKYIIKNCPAGQIVTSAINPNMAGVYCKMTHRPCQDCKDCVTKNIAERCKKHINAQEILYASEILQILEIEEV